MSFMLVPQNQSRKLGGLTAAGGTQIGNFMVHVYLQSNPFVVEGEGLVDI